MRNSNRNLYKVFSNKKRAYAYYKRYRKLDYEASNMLEREGKKIDVD